MAATTDLTVRTSEPPKLRIGRRVLEIWSYREILGNLVRKELKVKYTASVLGAVWSILNPIVFMAVFYFVVRMLGNPVPDFPVFLLAGLLPWNLFSATLTTGARSVIDNANLVKKVSFPREILPLAAVGVALVDFVLQSAVLLLWIAVSGHGFQVAALWLYPLSLVTLLVFTTAMTLWAASLNVRYRDVQHLLNLGLLVWFWMTPIVYQGYLVQSKLVDIQIAGVSAWNLYLLNPMASIVMGFQRALYGQQLIVYPDGVSEPVLPVVSLPWLAGVLGLVLAIGIALLYLCWRLFFRLSGDFAEEL
jgi:ABC-2 type transport system permease protein